MYRQQSFVLSLAIVLISLSAFKSFGQGWKWGVAPQFYPAVPEHGGFYPGQNTVDLSGNVYISGSTFNLYSSMFGPSSLISGSYTDVQTIIAKADSSGVFKWAISTQGHFSLPVGIATNTSGCLYLLGMYSDDTICVIGTDTLTSATAMVSSVYYLVKINPNGAVLWAKNIAAGAMSGGFSTNGPNGGIGIDATGNVYVTGMFNTTSILMSSDTLYNTNSAGGSTDIFIAKFDSAGNQIWANSYGGSDNDYSYSLGVTASGSVYVAGLYFSGTFNFGTTTLTNSLPGTDNNFFIAKFDRYGSPKWAKSAVGGTTHNEVGKLTTDTYGNVYMPGAFTQSTLTMGGITLTNGGAENAFFTKYVSSGNVKWLTSAKGVYSKGYGMAVDKCGNVWACGQMGSNLNFNGNSLTTPAVRYDPMFIVEYDTVGNYTNSMAMENGGGGISNITVDNRGRFFVSGDFVSDTIPTLFVIGPDTLRIDSQYQNLFVATYRYGDSIGCKIDTNTSVKYLFAPKDDDVLLYPNPADNVCFINSDVFSQNARVEIFDLQGRLIHTFRLPESHNIIDLAGFIPGMYQLKVYKDGVTVSYKKLVILKTQ